MRYRNSFTQTSLPKRLYRGLLVLLVLFVVGYGFFEARKLLVGPQITIDSPLPGSATSSRAIVVTGSAHNVSFLTINDAPAFTDESGHFALTLSPPPGYTVVTVAASDRFGRRTSESVTFTILDYCPV